MNRSPLLLLLLATAPLRAAELAYSCPASIAVTATASVPTGWETMTPPAAQHRLNGATFTDGHPKQLAFLKPRDAEELSKLTTATRRTIYDFPARYDQGIWLVCRYQNTPATLFQRLKETPKSCEVTTINKPAAVSIQSIRCW